MPTLLDILQGASNAAAGNVSGPVDLLAFALRKAGLGGMIGEAPVGGSAWMAKKGLTREPQSKLAGGVGEFLGMAGPIGAAAKAPQIAAGLLRGGENLAARRTLNPQTGAIVWHGSPHKFDRFDSSKIGTGEGAQAYGHGIYLADAPEVARSYRNAGADPSTFVPVRSIRDPAQMAATALERAGGDMRHAQAVLAQNAQSGDITAGAALELLKKQAALPESKYAGNLYKVDLPDEAIAKMLDWDAPLSQQAPEVQKAVNAVMEKRAAAAEAERLALNARSPGRLTHPVLGKIASRPRSALDYKGEAAVSSLVQELGGPEKAAAYLREQGIPGIRYLDGGSRGAGQGTRNFVVFPGEEQRLLKILQRNGQDLP